MPPVSETEARTYLSSKGVSTFIDQAIMKMLEEKPDDPVDWMQAYAARVKKARTTTNTKAKSARPGVIGGVREAAGPTWSQIASKLPAGRTNEDKLARAQLFNKIDVNQSEAVCLQETIDGMKEMLPFEGKQDIDAVMRRAYGLVRKLTAGAKEVRPNGCPPEDLTRPQFRFLLMYLRRYCELLAIIDEFDSDDDMKLDFDEFTKIAVHIEQWGVRIYYPEVAFKTMDKENSGEIPFADFADFVIEKELEQEPCTASEEVEASVVAEAKANKSAPPRQGAMKSAAVSSFRRGRTGAIDWALIAEKLPYGRSEVEQKRRKELFSLIDVNGNGYISLAEVDKGMRDILKLEEIFDCKPAMLRAFQAAKDVSKDTKARLGHDFVTKCEFRILLEYLRLYFELFVMFDRLDDDNDRRLSEDEFVRNSKFLKDWGVKATDLRGEFRKMDKNGGGKILFDEFCFWAIPQNLDLEDDDNR